MHDLSTDPEAESKYECLECGEIVAADSHPVACPNCGGGMQAREMSLE